MTLKWASLVFLWLCLSYRVIADVSICPTNTVGLCDPSVIESVVSETVTESFNEANGITTVETTTNTVTTTTITNADTGDILASGSGFVSSSKEGDMDVDWGGQGPASMPSGNSCGELGTDKCAMITGSGNTTSVMGVAGMGTTFTNTISLASLNIDKGGRTNYTIKVNKEDASDRIYMHITGYDGSTSTFSGTDILSESGINSGFASYSGGFDFGGNLTSLIVEIGGRDINLAVGPMFDDVTVNVLYNVINTIVTQNITSIETFISLNLGGDDISINIAEDIFEHNDVVDVGGVIVIEPMEGPSDETYTEIELQLDTPVIETIEINMDTELGGGTSVDVQSDSVLSSQEANLEAEIETNTEEVVEVKVTAKEIKEVKAETKTKEKVAEVKKEIKKEEPVKKVVVKKNNKEQKQKVANKIVKNMGSKGRYDSTNQLKTLMVMNVLADNKSFFDSQVTLTDNVKLFSDATIPDGIINDNNIALYLLQYGADTQMMALVDIQYK